MPVVIPILGYFSVGGYSPKTVSGAVFASFTGTTILLRNRHSPRQKSGCEARSDVLFSRHVSLRRSTWLVSGITITMPICILWRRCPRAERFFRSFWITAE